MSAIGIFSGYLSPEYPSHIVVDVTEFCNLACVHCPYVSLVKPKGRMRHQLSQALHTKLVRDIAANGRGLCRFVRYTGEGEPLLHPHMMDFLAEMSAIGMPATLTTNGLLLSDERCQAILASGAIAVDISLDAFKPETYAKIRVGGELAEAQAGVQRLLAAKRSAGSKLKVMTSFINQEGNQGEAEPFKAYWESQGVDLVFVRNLHSCAGLMEKTAEKLWAAAPTPRTPCLYPWERLLLKADGLVDFCPSDWKHGSQIGDYAQKTIKELWQGPEMTALRAAHCSGDFSAHPLCGHCPDWSVTYWPEEGPTYAAAVHKAEG